MGDKNPFKGLVDLYKEGVKDGDALGFADTYKKATEKLFEYIADYLKVYDHNDVHFVDLKFGDGYFIFGTGTNSKVSFRMEEAPGWLFGAWWSPVKKSDGEGYESDFVHCELFAQYESEIDKFKPSHSMFGDEFDVYLDKYRVQSGSENAFADVRFIIEEPYLAFYRDMTCADFNHEHCTKAYAKKYFNDYFKHKREVKEFQEESDRLTLNALLDVLNAAREKEHAVGFIYDSGECCHPRYEIVLRNDWEHDKEYPTESGCYGLGDFDFAEETYRKLCDLEKSREALARKKNLYWWSTVSHYLMLWDKKDYDERKAREAKHRFTILFDEAE